MKKAYEERTFSMAFECHEMVSSRIYVMALEATLSIQQKILTLCDYNKSTGNCSLHDLQTHPVTTISLK